MEELHLKTSNVNKCGRKSTISELDFKKVLLIHNKSINEYGKMLPLSHTVIKDMAQTLKVTDKCIYIKLKRHLESAKSSKFLIPIDNSETSDDENINDNIVEIKLSAEKRLMLLPTIPDNINMLKRSQMPVNWTYIVATLIYEAGIKTPCSYTFANRNIVDNELSTTAKCSECEAFFKINSEQNFKKLILTWIIKGSENTYHKKKRKIRSNIRSDIAEHILTSSVTCYIRQQGIRAQMVPHDPTPATIVRPGILKLLLISILF